MKRESGFTLLEVLVAMALLSMLGVAAALTLNSGLRSKQIMGDNISSLQRLQLTQQLIQRDLEQIVLRRGRGEQGDYRRQMLVADGRNDDAILLDFYRTGRRILPGAAPGSNLEHVRYRFLQARLIRDSIPLVDTPAGTAWHSATMMESLKDAKLRFFYNGDWIDQWPPVRTTTSRRSSTQLPDAVEFTLTTERHGAVTQVLLLPTPF